MRSIAHIEYNDNWTRRSWDRTSAAGRRKLKQSFALVKHGAYVPKESLKTGMAHSCIRSGKIALMQRAEAEGSR